MAPSDGTRRPASMPAPTAAPRSAESHNDRTHDSTVDTDGKNREAARLAGAGPIGPDEITTSNASLDDSVPESGDGLAGFDSRGRAHRMPIATQADFEAVDLGMTAAEIPYELEGELADSGVPLQRRSPGRLHYAMNHLRPTRVFELHRKN
ncbi:hypothetical protein F4827_002643 [Paraburkholderia bannensis]|uniref:DUF3005 domain-containing protein n=2 Tax=Burkholderiaceae TaxID=119060 RepID=A0A7W9WT06_9BURK|nr:MULTISPECIES: DUF3005 domain-containing protein [Paraburkholderia]MBB3257778.1 hypothetical protein [Paraburkholderia sp. WP4_3_2]MBB6102791.1 hypothetical protein [Paraburkholderia bannensis]